MRVLIPKVQSNCSYCSSFNLLATFSKMFPTWKIKEYVKPQELLSCNSPDLVFVYSEDLQSTKNIVKQIQEWRQKITWVGWFCSDGKKNNTRGEISSYLFNDFLFCPFSQDEFQWRLKRLEIKGPVEEDASSLQNEESIQELKIEGLIGKALTFTRIIKQIPLLAKSHYPVLIQGETGTGKELLARAIHYNGPQKDQPFLPINCSAIPETLFENELFGHEKGAFTGAVDTHKGMLAEAGHGTIFLDEVDSLSLSSQAKLLRVLQEKEMRPLGSSKMQRCEARILAATNEDLPSLIKMKSFREDLFYRLNILSVHLPPLRDRVEDIPDLVQNFLHIPENGNQNHKVEISSVCFEKLQAYHWPGNIRELEAVVRRAVTLEASRTINPENLDIPECTENFKVIGKTLQEIKRERLNQFEREYLNDVLSLTQGNVSWAAKKAGKERRTFQRLMHKHGITRLAFL